MNNISESSVVYIGGNGRSGTSLAAKIVNNLGFKELENTHSAKFESSPIVYSENSSNIDLDATVNLITKQTELSKQWFWKSPADLGCFPQWIYLFKNIKFIIMLRDPYKIARSSSEKESVPLDCYYKYIAETFNTIADAIVKAPCPILTVSHENLLSDRAAEVNKIAKFLNITKYDPEILIQRCFTESYSDKNGNNALFSTDEIDSDRKVAFANTYLPFINSRYSMINTLVADSERIAHLKDFINEKCHLSNELSDFGYDLRKKSYAESIYIFKKIIDSKLRDCITLNQNSNPVYIDKYYSIINTLLLAANRLRSSVQARYIGQINMWIKK